jgi:molybdate transport system ATP-binding protein
MKLEVEARRRQGGFQLEVAFATDDALAVVGPSGAGKTTLLEMLAGLRRPDAGRLVLDGEVLFDGARGVDVPPERRRIGYVPQDAGLFPHLDVRANVRFGLLRGERAAERRYDEALALCEIAPLCGRPPSTLSGGERQRVALARALCAAPRLLCLDEPLGALDVGLRARILPYLLRIRDEAGLPLIYVTHQVGEALALCARAILLADGRVRAEGPAAQVLEAGRVVASDPEAAFANLVDGVVRAVDGGTARLYADGGLELVVPRGGLEPGARAAFAVAAEDVLVSAQPLTAISARNVLPATVLAVERAGDDALVRLAVGISEWRVWLTRAALDELGLLPGRPAWAVVKTHSLRRLR